MKWIRGRWMFFLVGIFAIALIGIRFWSYFSSPIPLGYDHGMYRAFFMILQDQLPYIHLGQLPAWIQSTYEPLSGLIYIVTNSVAGLTPDMLLLRGVGVLHLLVSLFIYLLLRKYNKVTALLGVLLYLTSIIQYQVFWRGYLKQMLGVLFMLTAYYLIEKKSYRLLIPILTGLFTVNRTGAVFFLVSFVVYKIVIYVRQKDWTRKDVLMVGIAGVLSLVIYWPLLQAQVFSMIHPLFGQAFIGDQSGTFFDKQTYSMYNIIIILLCIVGCIVGWTKQFSKKMPTEFIGFSVGLVWVGLQLFFYNRVLGYMDIFVLMFAAYGISYMFFSENKRWKYTGIGLYILQLFVFCLYAYHMNFPLIVQKEFVSINQIPSLMSSPNDKIMVTDKKYSAFIMGYAGHNVIARGLFDLDPWTSAQWQYRHLVNGNIKCQLLNELGKDRRPKYLWIGSLQLPTPLDQATCLTKLLGDASYGFYLVNYPND